MSLIQRKHSQKKHGHTKPLKLGDIVDVFSSSDNKWIQGTVVETKRDSVSVLYGGKNSKWYIMSFTNQQQKSTTASSQYDDLNDLAMDTLDLRNNADIKCLFENEGSSTEQVLFSEKLKKINRRGWKQERILIITQKAIYYLKPGEFHKSRRRITIQDVAGVTLSSLSDQFVVRILSQERDYHFVSENKDKITQLLKQIYVKETHNNLVVIRSEQKDLSEIVSTKKNVNIIV